MKPGRILGNFCAKDGRKVVLRTPKWEDLDDLMRLINSLVEESADISRVEKVSRDEEIDWLSKVLGRLEKGETFYLVAEVCGRVIASSEVDLRTGYERHVGVIGIAVANGFRDLGIGAEIMKTLVGQARAMGLEVLTLTVFATNQRAIHVYKKMGFVQTGTIPKKHFKDGKYIDEVLMTYVLD